MSYILIGSQTSPFVRRMRMLMENIPHEFREVNIFETDDGIAVNKINPLNQIPVLIDGDQTILDSRQIFNYINLTHKLQNMDWNDENNLSIVTGAMDSGIALLLMKRSGMNINEPYMYVNRQKERIESVLNYMKPYLAGDGLKEWNFITMSLFCFLDWANFREIIKLSDHPEASKFHAAHASKPIVQNTAIPKG